MKKEFTTLFLICVLLRSWDELRDLNLDVDVNFSRCCGILTKRNWNTSQWCGLGAPICPYTSSITSIAVTCTAWNAKAAPSGHCGTHNLFLITLVQIVNPRTNTKKAELLII